jgi:hypothetical protein
VGQLSGMGGGGFGGPPWLCGKAWSAVVWRSIGGGLEKKMATALVLQRGGGAPGGAFIRDQLSGVVQGILHRFYLQFAPYLKDFRLDSKKGGKSSSITIWVDSSNDRRDFNSG